MTEQKPKKTLQTSRRTVVAGSAAAAVGTFLIPRFGLADDPEFVVKLGTVAPRKTPWERDLRKYRKRIKEETSGRVKIKAYFGGALGGENEMVPKLKRNKIQMFGGTFGALASVIPELGCLELPYLFPSLKASDAVLDGLADEIDGILWKNGFKLVFFSENGHRSIGTNFGFVKKPGDLSGRSIRSQPTDAHEYFWEAVGANPRPISVTETLTSLQTGDVDGADNTPLFMFAASWYQAITHFTVTRHIYQPGVVVASRDFWESVPKELQTVLAGDRDAQSKASRKGVRKIRGALLDNFEAAGVNVYSLSKSEQAAYAKVTAKTHDRFKKKYGGDLLGKIKKKL